jgi:hypothetical protein
MLLQYHSCDSSVVTRVAGRIESTSYMSSLMWLWLGLAT